MGSQVPHVITISNSTTNHTPGDKIRALETILYMPPTAIQFPVTIYKLEVIQDQVPYKVIMQFKEFKIPFTLVQRAILDCLEFDFNKERNAVSYRTTP